MDYNNCSNSDTILITIEQSTFISDGINDSQIKLYPNPTNGKIYLEFDDVLSDNLLVEIIDINGQKIISSEIKQNELNNKPEFDLSDYSQGIYFIASMVIYRNFKMFRVCTKHFCVFVKVSCVNTKFSYD